MQAYETAARERQVAHDADVAMLAGLLSVAYPALRAQILSRPADVVAIAKGKLRIARDLRSYRRLGASFIGDLGDLDVVRRGLRLFVAREKLRIAARELLEHEGGDIDTTAREILGPSRRCVSKSPWPKPASWAETRFGTPRASNGQRCAFTVLGMGKLGGRELNCGSDVDLHPVLRNRRRRGDS